MIDDRDLLERAMGRFEPEPGLAERVMRRRERKRRNQRIEAGVLGVAVAVAVALWVGRALLEAAPDETSISTPPVERIGFLGLPPEGAEPTPVHGKLLYYLETSARGAEPFDVHISVYADGRVIWERSGAVTGVPEGATETSTGFLTQKLSPEGVQMLKSEMFDTDLFDRNRHFRGEYAGQFTDGVGTFHGPSGVWLDVYGPRGKVTLSWYQKEGPQGPPTVSERQMLGMLVDRLAEPAAWLPDTAWDDREIRAFVASTYTVYMCCRGASPSQLPPPANQILVGGEQSNCVTTAQAKEIVEGFEASDMQLEDGWFPGGVSYRAWMVNEVVSVSPSLSPRC